MGVYLCDSNTDSFTLYHLQKKFWESYPYNGKGGEWGLV